MTGPFLALLLAFACRSPSGGELDAEATTLHRGAGFAVQVPLGSTVRTTSGALAADLPGGARWFDVWWTDRPPVPERALAQWAEAACRPVRWDRLAAPTEGTWATAGLCAIEDRPHWVLAALETHGERALLTVYLADRERVTYEDAAVDYVTSALSLGGGPDAVPTPDRAVVRATLRRLAASGGIGGAPVPGGGELGARLAEALDALWVARRANPPGPFAAP